MQGKFFSVSGFLFARFARYLLGTLLLLIASFTIMSFTTDENGKNTKKSDKDSASIKGFRSLFNGGNYDPDKPYLFQLNPKAVEFVEGYIAREKDDLEKMREWGKPYFAIYDKVLSENGLPKELKYLSVIESNLSSTLRSHAGAVGPWQLMPDEAKRYGLRRGKGKTDERTDFYKSTVAASKLLNELYDEFGDWLLVVAAYNGGVGGVKRAIKKAGSSNFWDLQYYLPQETRNHVKKFIATHYVFEGGGGWTCLTAEETAIQKTNIDEMVRPMSTATAASLSDTDLQSTSTISLSGKYNAGIIMKNLTLSMDDFNRLNPGFEKAISEGKTYQLRLPNEKMSLFEEKKHLILQQSVQLLLNSNQQSAPLAKGNAQA